MGKTATKKAAKKTVSRIPLEALHPSIRSFLINLREFTEEMDQFQEEVEALLTTHPGSGGDLKL